MRQTIRLTTRQAIDEVLSRDAEQRAGQDSTLVEYHGEVRVEGRHTPVHEVLFAYADGAMRAFDGAQWHEVQGPSAG